LHIAWPLWLELLLGMAVGIAGTALAARLSDASGAAFALAHHVFGALFLVFRIVGAGVGVVVTQALGAGRRDAADAVSRAALGASTWVGLGCALVATVGGPALLRAMQAPADVLPLAAPLLLALAPAMLLDAWNTSLGAVLRAHLRVRDTLAVVVAMQCVHLALMGPLMLGLQLPAWAGGATLPALGLPGYAVAVLVARALGFALYLWLWRQRLGLGLSFGMGFRMGFRMRQGAAAGTRLHAADFWRLPRAPLLAVARIGLPAAAENIAYRLAFMVSVAVVAGLGAQALATHAYAQQIIMVVLLGGLATGLSVEVLVGHLIGAGHFKQAHSLVKSALLRGLALSVVVATAAALAGPWLMRLFTADPHITQAAVTLLWLTVLLEPGRTFNLVVINALRAAGDARYPVQVGAASMVVVLAGGSWLLGSDAGLGWGLPGVWLAYAADEWLRGLLMWRRWQRLRWVPAARAARRGLAG
jgi:Na+-driven multidrug efflux pump